MTEFTEKLLEVLASEDFPKKQRRKLAAQLEGIIETKISNAIFDHEQDGH